MGVRRSWSVLVWNHHALDFLEDKEEEMDEVVLVDLAGKLAEDSGQVVVAINKLLEDVELLVDEGVRMRLTDREDEVVNELRSDTRAITWSSSRARMNINSV